MNYTKSKKLLSKKQMLRKRANEIIIPQPKITLSEFVAVVDRAMDAGKSPAKVGSLIESLP